MFYYLITIRSDRLLLGDAPLGKHSWSMGRDHWLVREAELIGKMNDYRVKARQRPLVLGTGGSHAEYVLHGDGEKHALMLGRLPLCPYSARAEIKRYPVAEATLLFAMNYERRNQNRPELVVGHD